MSGVVDLNTFYGYPPAINRTTGHVRAVRHRPDRACYDPPTQAFFHVVLTLDVDPTTGDFTGKNHLDIAVSDTPTRPAAWTHLPAPDVQDDGTARHARPCTAGTGPCIGDYPHIGADANGFYITTNEYSFFGPDFHGAQIYAFSKRALAAARRRMLVTQFDTTARDRRPPRLHRLAGHSPGSGDVDRPTAAPSSSCRSNAAEEASGDRRSRSNRILVWALTNTSSLDTPQPDARLLNDSSSPSATYSVPPHVRAEGRVDSRCGDCINDTDVTPFGKGCWRCSSRPSRRTTRCCRRWTATTPGCSRSATPTASSAARSTPRVKIGGDSQAGIAWFVRRPGRRRAASSSRATSPGRQQPDLPGHRRHRRAGGRDGVHPGRARATTRARPTPAIDARRRGPIQVAAAGLGPQDGFTGYKAFAAPNPPRPRWGDYGAAAVDGNDIWIASEYIGQTCTLAEYATASVRHLRGHPAPRWPTGAHGSAR